MSSDVGDVKGGRLPPGQVAVKQLLRWGLDHPGIARTNPRISLDTYVLAVDGDVEKPVSLSLDDVLRLPRVESMSDFHCVEGWSVLGCRWEGFTFRRVMDLVRPRETAVSATFECADGYTTSLALGELLREGVLLGYRLDGRSLELGYGFPLRLVVPDRYGYKSAMWVTRIRFVSSRELGYWEMRGYSDTADVWRNDRFSV
jgi:DMSO/TMAO reductase YedYZ molybdopterin-dependent catalytic subunit